MKIYLLKNVDNLGIIGDCLSVKAGYARNYLLPFNIAIPFEGEYCKIYKNLVCKLLKQKELLEKNININIEKINNIDLEIFKEAGKNGKLFGSINIKDIRNELLNKKNIDVEKKMIIINSNIKYLGKYKIYIRKKSKEEYIYFNLIVSQKK